MFLLLKNLTLKKKSKKKKVFFLSPNTSNVSGYSERRTIFIRRLSFTFKKPDFFFLKSEKGGVKTTKKKENGIVGNETVGLVYRYWEC